MNALPQSPAVLVVDDDPNVVILLHRVLRDLVTGHVVARAVVSTTHTSNLGVAEGVRAAIEHVAAGHLPALANPVGLVEVLLA